MKNTISKPIFYFFIFTFFYLPLFSQNLNVSGTSVTVNVDNCCSGQYNELAGGQKQDFTIPASVTNNAVTFNLRGGDGGFAKAGANCKSEGGDGATVNATFIVGHSTNQLKPGGKIRFIVGKHGKDETSGGTSWADGGGGGGTAVLYQPTQNDDWVILAVAGGGGGAYQGNLFGGCLDSQKGQGGRASESGGNGAGNGSGSGGSNGNGGGGGDAGQVSDTGGGGGAYSDGGIGQENVADGGALGYPNGGSGGVLSTSSSIGSGGWGFGGGGAAFGAGGGGGGYSGGGGGGKVDNGGGGGSYVNSSYDLASQKNDGGASGSTEHGYVTYQFETICIPEIASIEEISGFCGEPFSTATIQVHLTTPGGCANTYFALQGASGAYISGDGTFNLTIPGLHVVQLLQVINDIVVFADQQSFLVTFEDTAPPVAQCKNTTVSISSPSQLFTNFEDRLDNGSTDNCGIASLSSSHSGFSCSQIGTGANVTLTVTDNAGNTSTCTSIVTVRDGGAPVPDVTNLPTITGACSASVSTPTATDNCEGSISGTTNDPTNYTVPGTYTVTWNYKDSKNNTRSQEQTVIVTDQTSPVVTCPENITVDATLGSCNAIVDFSAAAVDNCDINVNPVTYTGNSSNVPAGSDRLLLVQMCHFGNVTSATYNNTPMTLAVKQNANIAGTCEIWYLPLGSGGAISSSASISGIGNPKSIKYITFANVDQSNPFSDVAQGKNKNTLFVNGRSKDMIYEGFMRKDGNAINPQSGQTEIFDASFNLSSSRCWGAYKASSDGKDTLKINTSNGAHVALVLQAKHRTQFSYSAASGSTFPLGTTTVSFSAIDQSNNSSSCSFNVTVQDTQNPTISCPDNITVNATSSDQDICTAPVTYSATAADNCNNTTLSQMAGLPSGDDFPVGTTMNTLVVTDAAGLTASCSFEVTVIDASPPEAYCQNFNLFLDASGNGSVTAAQINNNSYDICGSIGGFTLDVSSFTCNDLGPNPVVLTVSDENGNTSTCSATVSVQERVAPVALCQNQTIQLDANGNASTTEDAIDSGSSDVCGLSSLALDNNSFTCENLGNNTVILTATDDSGNTATCSATVTVEDNVNPTAICQDITIQLDDNGSASTTAVAVDNNSFDNCQMNGLNLSQTDFSCNDVDATNTVTLMVTDGEGLQSTCTASVTVEDNIAPKAQCQSAPIILYLNENGTTTLTPDMINDNSSDNCGSVSLEFNDGSTVKDYDCSNVNTGNLIVLKVVDQNGNQSTCSADVLIADIIAPVAICQDVTVQLDANGTTTVVPSSIDGGSTDNCGSAFANQAYFFDCSNIGENTATFTFHDISFNTSQCTVNITVEDVLPPTAICQDVTIQLDENSQASTTASAINNNSHDNCSVNALSLSQTSFSCNDVNAVNTVTLTVTDGEGLQSTCSTSVTVEDQVVPIAQCQDVTLQLDENGQATVTPEALDNGSSDACGISNIALSNNPVFNCTSAPTSLTLVVTDNHNNSATCSAIVTVEDISQPTISCPGDAVVDVIAGECFASVVVQLPISSDNCAVTTLRYRIREVDANGNNLVGEGWSSWNSSTQLDQVLEVGYWKVQWQAKDDANNQRKCSYIIVVRDLIPPKAICNNTVIAFNGEQAIFLDIDQVWNELASSDNCGDVFFVGLSLDQVTCNQLGSTIPVVATIEDSHGNTSACTANVSVTGLPCNWQLDPAGLGCAPGEASYAPVTQTFTLSSQGCYDPSPYRASDPHGFIQTQLCGDGEIIAQVTEVIGNGWAGISMRESNDLSAPMIQLLIDGVSMSRRELRQTAGSYAFVHHYPTQEKNWLRLSRSGNQFTASRSADGGNWEHVFITQIPMSSCIEIGLITMNGSETGEVTGTFQNVTISGVALLSAPANVDIDIAENPSPQSDFSIFPNPATDIVNLQLDHFIDQEVQVTIFNHLGQIQLQQQWEGLTQTNKQLQVGNMPAGTYWVEVRSAEQRVTRRLVVSGY